MLHARQGAAVGGTDAQAAVLRRPPPVPARATAACTRFPDAARGFKPGFCRSARFSQPYYGTIAAQNWTRVLGDASDMDTFMGGVDFAFHGLRFMVDIPAVRTELGAGPCFEDTRLLTCEALFPRCTHGCRPRKLCRSACAGFRAQCPATVQALPSVVPGDAGVTNSSRDITAREDAVGNSPAKVFYDFFALMLSDLDQESSLGACKRSNSGLTVVLQPVYDFFQSIYSHDGGTPPCLGDSPWFSDDDDCIGMEEVRRGIPSQEEARHFPAQGASAAQSSNVEACSPAWGPEDGFGSDTFAAAAACAPKS